MAYTYFENRYSTSNLEYVTNGGAGSFEPAGQKIAARSIIRGPRNLSSQSEPGGEERQGNEALVMRETQTAARAPQKGSDCRQDQKR